MFRSSRPTCAPCDASASCAATVDLPTPPLPESTNRRCRTEERRAAVAAASGSGPRGAVAHATCGRAGSGRALDLTSETCEATNARANERDRARDQPRKQRGQLAQGAKQPRPPWGGWTRAGRAAPRSPSVELIFRILQRSTTRHPRTWLGHPSHAAARPASSDPVPGQWAGAFSGTSTRSPLGCMLPSQ